MNMELKAPVPQQSTTTKTIKPNRSAQNLTAILSTAFLLLSAITLLISNGLQLYAIIQIQQDTIYYNQLAIAQNAVKTLNGFIEDKFTVLSTIAWQINPNEASSIAQTQMLTSLLVRQPKFNQLILFDSHNKETAIASRIVINSNASYTKFASFITDKTLNQIKDGQRYISSVYYDRFTGAPLVVMAVPMTDVLGNYQGTLAAELNLISIWPLVNNLEVGKTGYVYVVDNQGNLVAFKEAKRELAGENVAHISEVKKFVENPEATTDITPDVTPYTGLTGTTVVGRYLPLGTPQWAVVIESPIREAYDEAIAHAIQSVLVILGMIILAGLAGRYLARRLATPLTELTTIANQVTDGRLELQATPSGSMEVRSLAHAFNSMTSQVRNLIGNLEKRVAERTADLELANQRNERRADQFEAIAQVTQSITSTQSLETLLPQVTNLISQHFGFYHVGIFLVDSGQEYAIMQAANSEDGLRMLERGHRLKLGTGLVGYAAQTGQPRIALNVGADAVFFNNQDLPGTHSEAALPMKSRGETIGVLDVQSKDENAFSTEDLQVLTTLANQVAIALENSRLLTETRAALTQVQEVYNEFTRAEWSRIASSDETQKGFRYQPGKIETIETPIDQPEIRAALQSGRAAANQMETFAGKRAAVAVPVRLRGEIIGVLQVESEDPSRQWTEDDITLIEAVAERAALAMENARLFQDARRRASKERTISEATARISGSLNIENILHATAEELERVLGGSEVLIQFQNKQ